MKVRAKNEDALIKEQEEKKKRREEKAMEAAVASGNAMARQSAFVSQVAAIESAASAARSKGYSTNGKIVGIQAIASAYAGGIGASIPDIGEELNLEADELDPNMIRPGTQRPYETAPQTISQDRAGNQTPTPILDEPEPEKRVPTMDFDLEL